ncbi:hypothetical protein ACWA7J_06960 [Leptothrix sp. BB-4]
MASNFTSATATGQAQKPIATPATTIGVVSGDDRVNAAEVALGVRVTGTSVPLGLVRVMWGSSSRVVMTDATGQWSMAFEPGEVPRGDGIRTSISAQPIGNPLVPSAPVTRSVLVDTTPPAKPVILAVTGDDKINVAEAAAGIKVSGTAEMNSRVEVRWGTVMKSVQTDGKGNWNADFTSQEVMGNRNARDIVALAVDASGNVGQSTVRQSPVFDLVAPMAPVVLKVAVDDHLSPAEARDSVYVRGLGEPGATVVVQWDRYTRSVTVDRWGEWTTQFTSNEVMSVTSAVVDVTARLIDTAGNVSAVTHHAVTRDGVAAGASTLMAAEGVTAAVAVADAAAQSGRPGPDADHGWPGGNRPPVIGNGTTLNPVSGDNLINAQEVRDGVTVSGMATAKGQVRVQWGNTIKSVATDDAGNWTAAFSATEIPVSTSGWGRETEIRAQFTDGTTGKVSGWMRESVRVDTVAPKASSLVVDTQVTEAEVSAGVAVSGVAEADASLIVKWGDASKTVTANHRGVWSTTFEAAQILVKDPAARTVEVSAQAFDVAGNAGETVRQNVVVAGMSPGDPAAPAVPVTIQAVAGNDVLLAAEAAAGVAVSGTAAAGRWVQVHWGDADKVVLADAGGHWQVSFGKDQVPAVNGVNVDVTAKLLNPPTADANPVVVHPVLVDTVAPLSPVIVAVAGDGKVNAKEAAAGVDISGTAEAHTLVKVGWGATSHSVMSDDAGAWATTFTQAEIPSRPSDRAVTASAVDDHGNSSETSLMGVMVDLFAPATPWVLAVAGDNRVTAAEAAAGVKVTGYTEPNAGVTVHWGDVSKTVTADRFGHWSAPFVASEIQGSTARTVDLGVEAFDAVGNHSAITHRMLTVDAATTSATLSLADTAYLSHAVLG